jgi:hypothetical protein
VSMVVTFVKALVISKISPLLVPTATVPLGATSMPTE